MKAGNKYEQYMNPEVEVLVLNQEVALLASSMTIGGSTEDIGTRMGDGGNLEQFECDEEVGW